MELEHLTHLALIIRIRLRLMRKGLKNLIWKRSVISLQYPINLLLGAVFEFIDRPDGLPGFQDEYNIKFKDVKGMDHGMMYRSFASKEVDVINSYTTDGQLQMYDLKVLEDDRSYFPTISCSSACKGRYIGEVS